MKTFPAVRIEIEPDKPEEVIIRCRSLSDDVIALQRTIEEGTRERDEMLLTLGEREFFVKYSEILFFETTENGICAHTKRNMFYTDSTLRELSLTLPRRFMRVSKSCIVNIDRVYSLAKGLSSVCEICFTDTDKKAYVSRLYYRPFREMLEEMRLGK